MVHSAMESHGNEEDNRAAQVIRKSIANFTKAAKDTNTIEVTSDMHDVAAELYTVIRWIMIGPAVSLECQRRTKVVDRAALMVSQNITYGFKSQRQVSYKPRTESQQTTSSTRKPTGPGTGSDCSSRHPQQDADGSSQCT